MVIVDGSNTGQRPRIVLSCFRAAGGCTYAAYRDFICVISLKDSRAEVSPPTDDNEATQNHAVAGRLSNRDPRSLGVHACSDIHRRQLLEE